MDKIPLNPPFSRKGENEPKDCGWHKAEKPLPEDYNYDQGCVNCGMAYETRICPHCGETFLDWWSDTPPFHDVFVFPRVTSSGDLVCSRCISEMESHDEAEEDDPGELNAENDPGE